MGSNLGDLLVQEKLINRDQLKEVEDFQKKNDVSTGTAIISLGYISEEDMAQALSRQLGYPYINLDQFEVYPDVINLIPVEIASKYLIMPIHRIRSFLTLAMVDPTDLDIIEDIRFRTGLSIQPVIASETGISSHRLRTGQLREDEWGKFAQATSILSEQNIFVDDTPSISAMQMRTKCRRLHAEHGLDIIIVDYLQLMQGDRRSENRVQEISYISRMLKGLARELNLPVMAASQLSRAVEQRHDKHPILSDLRESGSIEQDADIVMFIYRDEVYNPETPLRNIAEIVVSKHRHGPTGVVELYFEKELTRFRELERDRVDLAF